MRLLLAGQRLLADQPGASVARDPERPDATDGFRAIEPRTPSISLRVKQQSGAGVFFLEISMAEAACDN
jgi:hypothetical protein